MENYSLPSKSPNLKSDPYQSVVDDNYNKVKNIN